MDLETLNTAQNLQRRIKNLVFMVETKKRMSISIQEEFEIDILDLFGKGNESVFSDFLKAQLDKTRKEFEKL